jgi:4-hydroxy-3-methylbut-2-en-1-yl diphosphate reductase
LLNKPYACPVRQRRFRDVPLGKANAAKALEICFDIGSDRLFQALVRSGGLMVKVVLAQPRGFCAGVIRAIEIVDRALDRVGAPVYVRHEIVHNRHVVDTLRAKGAVFVEDLSEVPDGAVTVFSAHGVAREVEQEAKARSLPVLDATCPLVSKVHNQGRRYVAGGRTLILIGHAGHPEVEGTLGQIDAKVHLVGSVDDVAELDLPDDAPVAYITQTTLSVDDTRSVIAALNARFNDVTGPDTSDICYATQNRQTAVRDLCKVSDLLLVVGSSNSSNSNRLREIGLEAGLPSYLVSDGSALDPAWLEGVEVLGLTAGASAPEELVQSVITAVAAHVPVTVESLDGIEEKIEFRLPPALNRLPIGTAALQEI